MPRVRRIVNKTVQRKHKIKIKSIEEEMKISLHFFKLKNLTLKSSNVKEDFRFIFKRRGCCVMSTLRCITSLLSLQRIPFNRITLRYQTLRNLDKFGQVWTSLDEFRRVWMSSSSTCECRLSVLIWHLRIDGEH